MVTECCSGDNTLDPNQMKPSKGGGKMVKLGGVFRCPICVFCRLYKKLLRKGKQFPEDPAFIGVRMKYVLRSLLLELPKTMLNPRWMHKLWPIISSDPLFIFLLSQSSKLNTRLLFQETIFRGDRTEDNELINTYSIDTEGVVTTRILCFLPEEVVIMASCNGLICCRGCIAEQDFTIYICKPTTKEWTTIRAPRSHKESAFGLVYDPFDPSSFKVVCVWRSGFAPSTYFFDIYCSRTGTWRTSKEICSFPYNLRKYRCFYLNNVLHWPTSDHFIFAFDVKKEKSAVIRLPGSVCQSMDKALYFEGNYRECLGEWDGLLGYLRVSSCQLDVSRLMSSEFGDWQVRERWSIRRLEDRFPQLRSHDGHDLRLEPLALKDDVVYLRQGARIFILDVESRTMEHSDSLSKTGAPHGCDFPVAHLFGSILLLPACKHHTPLKKQMNFRYVKRRCSRWRMENTEAQFQALRGGLENDDILREVFSWMSVKPLSRMKCVSKRWFHLISDPSLIRIQFQRSKATSGFFLQEQHLLENDFIEDGEADYYFPIDKKDMVEYRWLKFLPEEVFIVASCNGLICCRSVLGKIDPFLYICNPTLKEWIYVRHHHERAKVFGLAFDPFGSPSGIAGFKLVVGHKTGVDRASLSFEIYSSETRSWRISTETRYWPYELHGTNGIYAKGMLHWMSCKSPYILAFVVGEDCSLVLRLPGPTINTDTSGKCLGESEGCVHYVTSSTAAISVWVLVGYSSSEWKLKYRVSLHSLVRDSSLDPGQCSLLRGVSLEDDDSRNNPLLEVLAFKDEVLFMRVELVFYAFNLNLGRMERIGSLTAEKFSSWEFPSVHPKICSMFSLHALNMNGR